MIEHNGWWWWWWLVRGITLILIYQASKKSGNNMNQGCVDHFNLLLANITKWSRMWKSFAWKNPDPSISAKAYFNMYSVQICRRKATYLDEDSAKDVSSAEIFIRKCEPAIRKKGKRTAHSWGVILVIFKDGSVLSYSRGKKLLDMYFLKMSYLIEGSRKNREKIDYSLMEASNFPGQTLQYNQYEKPKIKKDTLEWERMNWQLLLCRKLKKN